MRVVPAVTLYNQGAANAQIRNFITATDWSASVANVVNESLASLSGTSPAGSAAGHAAYVALTADAEI
jgi:hypothetical protein